MSDVIEGGAPAGEALTEQQQIEADAVEKFRKSQPGYVDPNPEVIEGHNADGTPITPEDNIPEKFKGKSLEEVIAIYQDLEKKQNKPPEETPPKVETPPPADDKPNQDATGFTKFTDEYTKTGTISEDSYKELADKGFSKVDIDTYIEGQKALGSNFASSIHEITGGEEGYTELINWAVEGMDAESITEYNEALQSGDQAKVKRLVEYMALKRGQATPNHPNRINGSGEGGGSGLKTFANKSEWMIATNDRLYGKDRKYTEMVDNRYLKSKRKGTL